MEPVDFIRRLTTECRDAAVADCVALFEQPLGRRPSEALVQLSEWFRKLPAGDRDFVVRAMKNSADATLFGVLCVIDGVRVIESTASKTDFTLSATRDGVVSVISPGEEFLHDIYRSEA